MVRSNLKESTIFNHGAGSAPKGQCFLFGWNYAKYEFNLYKGFFIGKNNPNLLDWIERRKIQIIIFLW